MKIPKSIAVVLLMLSWMYSSAQQTITIKSYFDAGFGTVIHRNILFKKIQTSKGVIAPRADYWIACKPEEKLDLDGSSGIGLIFETRNVKETFDRLTKDKQIANLIVEGYETIQGNGEPVRGKDVSTSIPINGVAWKAMRYLVIRDVYQDNRKGQ